MIEFRLIPGIVQGSQTIIHNDGLWLTRLVLALGQQSIDAEGFLGLTLGGWQECGCGHGGSTVAQVIGSGLR